MPIVSLMFILFMRCVKEDLMVSHFLDSVIDVARSQRKLCSLQG